MIKFKNSLYGLNQASENLFGLLKTGLERMGYNQYQVDPYVLYRNDLFILTCVYDCVIVSHKQETIISLI